MERSQGKVAFITGVARGQDRSYAVRLEQEGMKETARPVAPAPKDAMRLGDCPRDGIISVRQSEDARR